ncbi:MAG: sigma 54-interacting transcriptional regulator, partial [Acidobacteria bacterium]|nr:sigma 54-interacting transcriptional regulator [Acidobacteriota bacterium]
MQRRYTADSMPESPGAGKYRYVLEDARPEIEPRVRFYLAVGSQIAGSAADCDLRPQAEGVSRRHARLEVLEDGGLLVEDLGSRNGTWLGSRRIRKAATSGGEMLSFGSLAMELTSLDDMGAQLAFVGSGRQGSGPTLRERAGQASTMGLSLEERLLGSLRALARGPGRGDPSQLARRWLSELLLERVEILAADGALTAAGGEETLRKPDLEVADGTIALRLWGPAGQRLERLRPLLDLALDLLAPNGEEDPALAARASAELPAPGSLSPRVRRVYQRAAKVAVGEIPVLILGESGAGKDVLARWIHGRSRRRQAPFLALNCAALPRELLEAEIFGIERGVATGVEARPGLLERAHGGTLFLDEIGDMALETQAKVLRALEDQRIYRVGGRAQIPVDVRFLAATNRDIGKSLETREFREDLYHRLAAHVAELPALRERPEDIALLAGHFFRRELQKQGARSPGMARPALAALT